MILPKNHVCGFFGRVEFHVLLTEFVFAVAI